MSKNLPLDVAFGKLLHEIVQSGHLLAITNKKGLHREIARYIRQKTGISCTEATVRGWFNGDSRPWKDPAKVKALYDFFKVRKRIPNKELLVKILFLCEYHVIKQLLIEEGFPPPPRINRVLRNNSGIPRTDLLDRFHNVLSARINRDVGIFLLGSAPKCGSSNFLLQVLQRYTDIHNYLLPVPFTHIVYIDCENKQPHFPTIATEIYRQIKGIPFTGRRLQRQELHTLLEDQSPNDHKALLLALDNVPKIPDGSDTQRFLDNLVKPHVAILTSSRRILEQPVEFPVGGFTTTEMKQYAKDKCPKKILNDEVALKRVSELTGGIPFLLYWALSSIKNDTVIHAESDYQTFSSEVTRRIRIIYSLSWNRLKSHPEWEAIRTLLCVLPIDGKPVEAHTLRQKAQLTFGRFASAIHALKHEFLVIERDLEENEEHQSTVYEIAYPFRWFAQTNL